MAFDADMRTDRLRLKRGVSIWRALFVLAVLAAAVVATVLSVVCPTEVVRVVTVAAAPVDDTAVSGVDPSIAAAS